MKKSRSSLLAAIAASALLAIAPVAPATASTATASGSLNFNFDALTGQISSVSNVTWNPSTPGTAYTTATYACKNPVNVATATPIGFSNSHFGFSGTGFCSQLFASSSVTDNAAATDLTDAYLDGNSPRTQFDPDLLQQGYISMVSFGPADSVNNDVWIMHTASVLYKTYAAAPSISTQPALSLNGSQIVATDAVWSPAGSTYQILACPLSQSAVETPTSSIAALGQCNILYGSSDSNDFSPATDMATALLGPARVPYTQISGTEIVLRSTHSSSGEQVATASVRYSTNSGTNPPGMNPNPGSNEGISAPAPYTGPIITAPAVTSTVAAGSTMTLPGTNLETVTEVEIDGVKIPATVNATGQLEFEIPAALAAGDYDLVVVSSSGRVTLSGAVKVSGTVSESVQATGDPVGSTKRMENNTVKAWAFNAAGAGKVQILLNGEEIAWVRTNDPNDPKLRDGYLVRTINLEMGKNVVEVVVDGETIRRTVYTR